MELLGAKVNAVTSGTMTLKDAVNEAMGNAAPRRLTSYQSYILVIDKIIEHTHSV